MIGHLPDYEERTCTEEYYNEKFALREGGNWKDRGSEHSITEQGNIKRRRERDVKVWLIELNSLEELMEFVKENGQCIVTSYKHPAIEIYDDYRE